MINLPLHLANIVFLIKVSYCVRDLWTREPAVIAANVEIPVFVSSEIEDIMEQLALLPPEILHICAIVQQLSGFSFVCTRLALVGNHF